MSLNQRPTQPCINKTSSSPPKVSDRLHLSQNRPCHATWSCFPHRPFGVLQPPLCVLPKQHAKEISQGMKPRRICKSRTPSRHQFLSLCQELSLPWKVKFVTRKENFTIVCLNNLGSRIFSQVLFPHKANVSIILLSKITIYYPCRRP